MKKNNLLTYVIVALASRPTLSKVIESPNIRQSRKNGHSFNSNVQAVKFKALQRGR